MFVGKVAATIDSVSKAKEAAERSGAFGREIEVAEALIEELEIHVGV